MIIQGVALKGVTVIDSGIPSPSYTAPDYATAGIQMYYNPEDPSSYSGSGTTLADLSANGHDATVVNGATFSTNSFTLDGVNDYIASPNMVSSFNGSSAFSIEIWYAPNYTVQGDGGCIVQESGVVSPNTTWFYAVMEHRKAPFGSLAYDYANIYTGSGLVNVNPLSTFSNLVWRQQILTYDGSSAKIYTNSSLARTVSLARSTPWSYGYGYHLLIGAGTSTNQSTKGNLNFRGQVGIVRAYNRAITAAEVTQNWNGAKSIYGL